MNLGEHLADSLLKENTKTIALYPGAFKPPHRGHFELVKRLSKVSDEVLIIISPIARDGITAQQSLNVWKLYLPYLPKAKAIISPHSSPVSYVYDTLKNNPLNQFIVAFGKNDDKRFNSLLNKEKYPNVKVYDAGNVDSLSSTNLRNSLKSSNSEEIARYLPFEITVDDFTKAIDVNLQPSEITENLSSHAEYELKKAGLFDEDSDYGGMIGEAVLELIQIMSKQGHSGFSAQWVRELFNKLSNYETLTPITENSDEWTDVAEYECGEEKETLWQSKRNPAIFSKDGGKTWYHVDGKTLEEGIKKALTAFIILEDKKGIDMYSLELARGLEESQNEELTFKEALASLTKYFIDNGYEINPLPKVKILNDKENSNKLLGKTAYYDPNNKEIILYKTGRHQKDQLRSISHELIHHMQNLKGELNNINTTDTNNSEELKKMEEEAYLKGNMIFRNWEDKIKND